MPDLKDRREEVVDRKLEWKDRVRSSG